MSPLSNWFVDQVLNEKFRDAAATKLNNLSVRLYSVLPNAAGTGGTELTGTGYAAQTLATTDAGVSAPTGTPRTVDNAAVVDFGIAGSDWAPPAGPLCVGFGLWDGANYVGGNTWTSGPIAIQNGNPVRFPAGELNVTLQ